MDLLFHAPSSKFLGFTIFLSIATFQIAYIFIQWVNIQRPEYLFYIGYMLSTIFYAFNEFDHLLSFQVLNTIDPNFYWIFRHALSFLCIYMYYRFARSFLDLQSTHSDLHLWMRRTEWFILSYIFISPVLIFSGVALWVEEITFLLACSVVFIITFWLIISIYLKSLRLKRFILWGASLLMAGSVGSLFGLMLRDRGYELPFDPFLPLMLGVIAELLTFTTGLAYKTRLQERERILTQQEFFRERNKLELEKQKAILETQKKERERLARELHDDLGSGITAIKLMSEVAKKQSESASAELSKISECAGRLMDSINEIVWAMNIKNDSLPNLLSYLRATTAMVLDDVKMQYVIEINGEATAVEVNGEARRNIYLVVKEALNNILKHANAKKVHIIISAANDLEIKIQDDGQGGFDGNEKKFRNGMKNMSERMALIGGKFTIENSLNGTTVLIVFPLIKNNTSVKVASISEL